MRKQSLLSVVFFAFLAASAIAQNVTRLDPYKEEYLPDVILVKFADDINVPIQQQGRLGKSALSGLFQEYGIEEGERLFPNAEPEKALRIIRGYDGSEHEVGSLYNIFKFKLSKGHNPKEVAEKLRDHGAVKFAEPDYLFYTLERNPGINSLAKNKSSEQSSNSKYTGIVPNDPLYNQQWYLKAFPGVNAEQAWDLTTGDTTQIIGVIDTGVDWHHPDLDDKIWRNYKEIPNNRIDDDRNGYVDDIRGWDFINQDNDSNDDNSHGTHVAGIAAAETNNSIGIAGVAWNAKIMAVKAFQSTGVASSSDLAQALDYAAKNGATVINMSWGGYFESQVLRTALENAFGFAVLAAAAGNDRLCIGPGSGCAPLFPAAYSFVLGVEATSQGGSLAGFSNFDQDGPIFSRWPELWNYEIRASGVSIYSTFPNGNYNSLNGTSMATPVVSGAVALMKSYDRTLSQEQILARVIQSAQNGLLDIRKSMEIKLVPDLRFVTYTLVDTLPGADRDGIPDAGETFQLYLTVRNTGGAADSVWTKLRIAPIEDRTIATVLDSTSRIGSVSTYATLTGENDPFQIIIDRKVVNNRQIRFQYEIGARNTGSVKGQIFITVQKGLEVGGLLTGTHVWTPDNFYLVVDNIRLAEDASLTVRPGTEIRLYPQKTIEVRGKLTMVGNKDSLIVFASNNPDQMGEGVVLQPVSNVINLIQYTRFISLRRALLLSAFSSSSANHVVKNNLFENCGNVGGSYIDLSSNKFDFSNNSIMNNTGSIRIGTLFTNRYFQSNLVINNVTGFISECRGGVNVSSSSSPFDESVVAKNSIFGNSCYGNPNVETSVSCSGGASFLPFKNVYWGTTDSVHIKEIAWDFFDHSILPILVFSPFLKKPSPESHGHVWKVEINGKNPQEVKIDPIGIEKFRFDVYFNRAMDKTFTPFLTFGVRDPFTQNVVSESPSWNADGTIWTAYFTVGLETGDGINRIRVASAKDPDRFEIPVERSRFKFVIQAASSASLNFVARPGIGKVNLEWPPAESPDVLGYNMYRFEPLNDSTFTDTTRINTTLITDTTYTDFNVIPRKPYYYMYKVVGTDLVESDFSKSVTAAPVQAASGDANGDLSVNVLDIVTIVNYILNKNPQPFLFEAADVNKDGLANVLDIVGVVNIIRGGGQPMAKSEASEKVRLLFYHDRIILEGGENVAGLQFKLQGAEENLTQVMASKTLTGFEMASANDENGHILVFYSLSGKTMAQEQEVLNFKTNGPIQIKDVVACTAQGQSLEVEVVDMSSISIPTRFELAQNYPNPFNPVTTLRFGLPQDSNVRIEVYNILGQRIMVLLDEKRKTGYHTIQWHGTNQSGIPVPTGLYFFVMKTEKFKAVRKALFIK